jgi:dTDP-4-dehydrorhamnose reductase
MVIAVTRRWLIHYRTVIVRLGEDESDVIVNAAAHRFFDIAEQEREMAIMINGKAPGVLVHAATRLGAILVHCSTD